MSSDASISQAKGSGWLGPVPAYLAGAVGLAIAVVGAILVGNESGVDGVNSFVENLSGTSGSFLGDLSFVAPLGFAFAAGMVSAVNPCGFAMLPAYLGLYLGSQGDGHHSTHPGRHVAKALVVGGAVTAGFVLLFGIAGVIIGAGARSIVDVIPWLGFAIGIVLTIGGSWLLAGGKLYSGLAGRLAAHVGNPGQLSLKGYFIFGLSYGMASLSCTLPIFLVVVVTTVTVSNVWAAIGQFILYALGMGLVIMALTVAIALFKGAMVGAVRRALPYIQPLGAALMIVAGSYIVFYWLTIGDLGTGIHDLFKG